MSTKADRLLRSPLLGIAITLGLLAVLYACLTKVTTVRAVDSNASEEPTSSECTPADGATLVDTCPADIVKSVTAGQGQLRSLWNPIPANSIVIDDQREGWEQVEAYCPSDRLCDNGGIGKVDWFWVTMAHDCNHLYVRYEVDDGPSILTDGARYNLLIDVDRDRSTGYWGSRKSFSIGADVLVQGATVFTFTGTTQEDWSWGEIHGYSVDERELPDSGRDIEYRIPISDLDVFGDGVTGFDWIAWADHTWGDDSIDLDDCDFYPDRGNSGAVGDFYTYSFISPLSNPERGFFRQTNTHVEFCLDQTLPAYQLLATEPGTSTLLCWREYYGTTLIHRNFWLGEFVTSTISQQYLDNMEADFKTVRAAGIKMIVRFAYAPECGEDGVYPCDASKQWILTHTQDLSDVLRSNSDVIAAVQAGFIGRWGEWWGSCHFPDLECCCSPDDPAWDDRRDVLFAVLDTLPVTRMVQLRTPRYKYNIFSDTVICSDCIPQVLTPVNESQAHTGIPVARTGHHNDCFLCSPTDAGTYCYTPTEYPYLQQETKYVVMGGETGDFHQFSGYDPNRLECETALEELDRFHWSFLSADWYSGTHKIWRDGGCFDEIGQRLGYRLVFSDATLPDYVMAGQSLQFDLRIMNEGYAAPYNPRAVRLVLSNTNNITHAPLYSPTMPPDQSRDPRFWLAGETHTSSYTVTIPMTLPGGTYELLLHLPDPELPGRPEYAIRLGGSEWEPSTGYNKLNRSITVIRIYLPIVLKKG